MGLSACVIHYVDLHPRIGAVNADLDFLVDHADIVGHHAGVGQAIERRLH